MCFFQTLASSNARFSRRVISLLMVDGVSPFALAAAEKLPCSLAHMKACSCEKLSIQVPWRHNTDLCSPPVWAGIATVRGVSLSSLRGLNNRLALAKMAQQCLQGVQ